jgi:hypothetical protein
MTVCVQEEGYPFTTEGVQQAHRDLAGRGSVGKLVIAVVPGATEPAGEST